MRDRILCIGQIVADIVVRPVDSFPEVGVCGILDDMQLVCGGCAANTASVLAKLGAKVGIAGKIGCDAFGSIVTAEIENCGVDTKGVVRDSSIPTSSVMVLVREDGERSFMYRPGGNEGVEYDDIPTDLIEKSGIVHVGGIMKLPRLDTAKVLSDTKKMSCITSVDTDWDPTGRWLEILEPALPYTDLLFTNESEGRMLTGRERPAEIGKSLLEKGAGTVIIKMGALGCAVVAPSGTQEFPGFGVDVLDTTCAGDSFCGGFLYGISKGWDTGKCAVFANAVGALSTTRISHRGVVSLAETERFLERKEGNK